MKKLLNPLYTVAVLCLMSFFGIACSEVAYDPVVPDNPLEMLDIKGRAGISDDDFCRYLDIENIHRTIPVVNRYIDNLPGNLDANQRAQALVAMFRSFRGITGARFLQDEYMRTPTVFFSFMDDGTDRELTLDFSSTGKVLSYYYNIVVGAHVQAKESVSVNQVFDFINSLDFNVNTIQFGSYASNAPSNEDNLNLILNFLKAKSYIGDRVYGYVSWPSNYLSFAVYLSEMHNREYQADWLKTAAELNKEYSYRNYGYVVEFQIPEDRTIPESYSIGMSDNDTFGFTHKQLNRIPDNAIWGYVAYHQASTSMLMESFLNDLTGAGAVKKVYRPGYYLHFEIDESGDIVQPVPGTTGHYFDRLFVYDYQGDLANIDRLVEQYALDYGSDMSIMLYTESGEEFRSWMYDR